jgi:hypothetical protein
MSLSAAESVQHEAVTHVVGEFGVLVAGDEAGVAELAEGDALVVAAAAGVEGAGGELGEDAGFGRYTLAEVVRKFW